MVNLNIPPGPFVNVVQFCPMLYFGIDGPTSQELLPLMSYPLYSAGNPILYEIFPAEIVSGQIGGVRYMELSNNLFVCKSYHSIDINYITNSVIYDLYDLHVLIQSLWLVKDNSCNVGSVSAIVNLPFNLGVIERNLEKKYKNAIGFLAPTVFSNAELRQAFSYYESIIKLYNDHKPIKDEGKNKGGKKTANIAKKSDRILRAYEMLQNARTKPVIPEKIANYVIILESLFFPNSNNDISHKVAERVSFYFGGNREERKKNFQSVKDGYSIRSTFVHGDTQKKPFNKEETLKNKSIEIDEIIRKVFRKILKQDYELFSNDVELKNMLDDLIFTDYPLQLEKPSDVY